MLRYNILHTSHVPNGHSIIMERQLSFSRWSLIIFLTFFKLTVCRSNNPDLPDIYSDVLSDVENVIKGDVHYNRLVWDPTSTKTFVFNISETSPLHVMLIRKKVGHCEMFFLRLKGILQSRSSSWMIACIAKLTANSLQQKCNWVNDSDSININQGNIYGMPDDCGPWYLTVFVAGTSNYTTELAMEVSSPYDPLAFRWFRVLTNIAFLPAIFLALKRRFYAEAIIYFLTFVLSWIYHLCEAELHCFKNYTRLHYSDYYTSDLSIIATIWSMTRIKAQNKHLVFLTVAILLQFAVTETTNTTYHFHINLLLSAPALLYLCYQYVYRTVKYRTIYPSPRRWLLNLIPGFSLATTGALVMLLVSENDNYYYVHCVWHITIMLSVAFLLPVPTEEDRDERWWMDKMDKHNYAPLL